MAVFHWGSWRRQSRISWVKASPMLAFILACSTCFVVVASERNYKIYMDKFLVVSFDETFGDFSGLQTVKYNRSTTALSGTFELATDPRPELLLSIEGYEKIGPQYVLSGIQFREDTLCRIFEKYSSIIISPDDTTTTNFTLKCPLKKGLYYIDNYRPDENNMPEDVPGNNWRFDVKARYPEQLDKLVFHLQAFLKIERMVTNWKPGRK